MEVIKQERPRAVEITVVGDLDADGAIDLDAVINQTLVEKKYNIIVNGEHLNFMSSAGVGVFISYLDEIGNNNGRFVFTNISERIMSLFQLLGLENIVDIMEYDEVKKEFYEG